MMGTDDSDEIKDDGEGPTRKVAFSPCSVAATAVTDVWEGHRPGRPGWLVPLPRLVLQPISGRRPYREYP